MMRIVLAFVTIVGAILCIAALVNGAAADLLYAGPITAIAGFFLLQNLRDPEVTRKNGLRARVSFGFAPGEGVAPKGTFALLQTHKGSWQVALDRMAEPGDLQMHGVPQRGWVWLDQSGLPARVKITYATSWKTWDVISAAAA